MNALEDIAAANDLAEGGEALAIGVALTAEVEGGLVADAEEKIGGGGVRAVAGHGDDSVGVLYASNIRALERNRREFKGTFSRPGLDDGNLDLTHRLIVQANGAMKAALGVAIALHVAEEVTGREGSFPGHDDEFDFAGAGLDDDVRVGGERQQE